MGSRWVRANSTSRAAGEGFTALRAADRVLRSPAARRIPPECPTRREPTMCSCWAAATPRCARRSPRAAPGASVLVVESRAARSFAAATAATRATCARMHDGPLDVLTDAYPEEEYWQDLLKVTGGLTDEKLARMTIRDTEQHLPWMRRHGVRFQAAARRHAAARAHQRVLPRRRQGAAQRLLPRGGGARRARSPTTREVVDLDDRRRTLRVGDACCAAAREHDDRARRRWSRPRAASSRTSSGCARPGAPPADNFIVRGTPYNMGTVLKLLLARGAKPVGDRDAGPLRGDRRALAASSTAAS